MVYATYDGFVRCQDLITGNLLWEVNLHSFPFDLHLDDLNGDGRPEIFCTAASGKLFVISPEGIIRWTFESELPLYDVGTGQIIPGGEKEVVCGGIDRHVYLLDHTGQLIAKTEKAGRLVHPLKVADLNNNGKDDIIAIDHRHEMKVFEWNGTGIDTLFTRTLTVPERYRNWENPGSMFNVFSLVTGDIDNDGIPELVAGDSYANKQAVMAMTSAGRQLWISDKQPFFTHIGETQTEFYSMALVGIAELDENSPGKEVLSVAGGMVRLISNQGRIIKEVNAAIGFTDLFIDGKILYLGSSPNGDETVYRVDMAGDWVVQIAALRRYGKMQEIESNLASFRSSVENYLPTRDFDPKPYDIYLWPFRIRAFNEDSYQEYISLEKWFAGQFPYRNIRPVVITGAMEPTPPLDEKGEPWNPWRWNIDVIRGTQTVEEIVDRARWIEEHKIPTLFSIGHSCMPFITLETAEKILQAAPEYCVGFITSEDENIDLLPRYIEHFFAPLADLCVKYGYKKCITRNKNLWWMSVPSILSVYENLFKGERKKVVVAATEDSNSRCPELNLMGRGGLYLAGLIENNDVSIHADLFSFNRYFLSHAGQRSGIFT